MNDELPQSIPMQVQLARIEEKLNSISGGQQSWQLESDRVHHDHEVRLRAIERWRWSLPVTTLASTISAAGAITAAVISLKGG